MATCSEETTSEHSIFDRIASDILLTYANIIEAATKRRDRLLIELNEMRIEFEEKIKTRTADLRELQQMREQIMRMCVKQNTVLKIQEASLAPINKQILNLKTEPITEPGITFEFPLTDILEKLNNLGTIVVKEKEIVEVKQINYSSKNKSKRTIGYWESNNQTPNQIHVSKDGQLVFLPNVDTQSVHVYDVESGKEWKEFNQGLLAPYAVTTNDEYCFVTDCNQHKIFLYRIRDYLLLNSADTTGGSSKLLSRPTGLTANANELFVADHGNNRVCVYTVDLNYVTEIGVSILKTPKDVKLFRDEIYVLDPKEFLHSFSRAGDHIRSVLTCGSGKQLAFPTSFCIDQDGNFIIADHEDKALKVFSHEGELMHQIGEAIPGTEEVGYCFGVAVSKDSVFMSSLSFKCIKVF